MRTAEENADVSVIIAAVPARKEISGTRPITILRGKLRDDGGFISKKELAFLFSISSSPSSSQ